MFRLFGKLFIAFFILIILWVLGQFLFAQKTYAGDSSLVINELFPAPSDGNEFVELYNASNQEIKLSSGWQLDDIADGGSKPYDIVAGTIIEPYGYLVFYKKIGLNNDGDTVRLLKDNIEISTVSYTIALKDMSYVRETSGIWFWTKNVTPGIVNPERPDYSKQVYINEILPYPENGSDNEFVELYNSGDQAVDLSDWRLDDVIGGGASAYEIGQGTTIVPHDYLIFYKRDTQLTLNDDGDEVNLINPAGERISSIPYSKSKKSETYIRTRDGFWRWTITATPLSENILRLPCTQNFNSSFTDLQVIPIKTGAASVYEGRKVEIIGEVIETSGDTFFLDDGSGRVKCYIQAKTGIDKPKMFKKDKVRVIGIVNLYRGVWRILPEHQEDVEILERVKAEPKISSPKNKSSSESGTQIINIGVEHAYAESEAQNLLDDIYNSRGLVKGENSNIAGKITFWVVITAVFLLILLIGEYLWKKRLQLNQPKKQKNLPNDSP